MTFQRRRPLRLPLALLAALGALAAAVPAAAETTTFAIDAGHSDVSFLIRHMMSKVRGTFNDFSGTIVRDDQDPSKSSVELVIQAASIDTRNDSRDEDLRGEDFFEVAKFPTITFKSTAVEKVSDNFYKVTGDFTMHGVTKSITLPVGFSGQLKDARGNLRAGFSMDTKLDRKEYGIIWNRALDSGGHLLSDEVDISINIEAKQQAPAPPPTQQ